MANDDNELAQRLGGFTTLCEGLDYAAQGRASMNFYGPRGQLEESVSYHQLRSRAISAAHQLINAGMKRGERVGIVAETGADFMVVFFGCQYAGLVPCPLPYSMYIGGRESYMARIAVMLQCAHATTVVTTADLDDLVREAAGRAGVRRVLSHEQLAAYSSDGPALKPFGPDEISYIQYSSGSTSSPKGVLISQNAVCANTMAILRHGLKVRPTDRACSWLPLYHDMGLVGFCLSPMMGQVSVDYLSTPAFARRPALWLKLMSQNQCTVAFGPSFGYDLAARRANGVLADLKLDQWRVAGIGGDMVRADTLKQFAETLEVTGFNAKAFLPSYGMAESTLGVCFADADKEIRVDVIDRTELKENGLAKATPETDPDLVRSFVVCGRPLPGHKIRVVNGAGKKLGERKIGCIEIAGPSLMTGYFRNDAATSAIMRDDGFMDTGDMGYWLDGEIVITGRAKDLILHNGRNIWPEDIEWSVEKLDAVRDGDVAAFAVEDPYGEDYVTVLVQCRLRNDAEIEAVRTAVRSQISQASGVDAQVVMVPPKSLPFTSSGKLSRSAAKAMYMTGQIADINRARRISFVNKSSDSKNKKGKKTNYEEINIEKIAKQIAELNNTKKELDKFIKILNKNYTQSDISEIRIIGGNNPPAKYRMNKEEIINFNLDEIISTIKKEKLRKNDEIYIANLFNTTINVEFSNNPSDYTDKKEVEKKSQRWGRFLDALAEGSGKSVGALLGPLVKTSIGLALIYFAAKFLRILENLTISI